MAEKRRQQTLQTYFTKRLRQNEDDMSTCIPASVPAAVSPISTCCPATDKDKEIDMPTSSIPANPKSTCYPATADIGVITPSPSCMQAPPTQSQKSTTNRDLEEGLMLVNQLFPACTGTIHSYYSCRKSDCTTLGKEESERLSTKTDRFKHEWLFMRSSFADKQNLWWLVYIEGQGMYCLVCKKHFQRNSYNKSEKFVSEPSVRLKRSAVTSHANANVHTRSLEAETQQRRGSVIQKELEKKQSSHFNAVLKAFTTAYFLGREHIANRKFVPFLKLVEHLGLDDITYFEHRSQGSIRDVFMTIGDTIQDKICSDIRRSQGFGVLIDDVTDAAAMEQMITFAQYLNCGKPQIAYIGIRDVLESHESANAQALLDTFLQLLQDKNLKVEDVKGLCSDGASVMLGRKNGFAAKLKSQPGCDQMISVHCVCHRLALACCDTSANLGELKAVEDTLVHLWKWMEYSPQRTAAFLKAQLTLKGVAAPATTSAEKTVCRKLKKACHTRWLSFDAAVKAVFEDYWAILQTLSAFEKCAVATGLLKKMRNTHFLGTVMLLRNVLPHLAGLSKVFQANILNFSRIQPQIQYVKDRIQSLCDENVACEELEKELNPEDGRLRHTGIKFAEKDGERLKKLSTCYITALQRNIDARFQDSVGVISSFAIFDPSAVPSKD
ncbi:zinc finger protein 862-like [Pecten maximus]|uniref:zinc finger protein 862-like n=1 Tax=Pecten maximus TaxID=6579 RepID=UPI00145834D3|nr:zinc finger protein 862-like [Pecten maximus]